MVFYQALFNLVPYNLLAVVDPDISLDFIPVQTIYTTRLTMPLTL